MSLIDKIRANIVLSLYVLWTASVIGIVFMVNGLNPDNTTRILVLAYMLLTFALIGRIKSVAQRFSPRTAFVAICVISAAVVETFYMISDPLSDSLLITTQTPFVQALRNWAIDIAFTTPFYVALFLVVWHLINKYEFKTWEYVIFISLGQALGDGNSFYLVNPAMLWLIPYTMTNYQAINVAPYIAVRDKIKAEKNSRIKLLVAVIVIFVSYWIGGAILRLAGAFTGIY